MLRRPTLRVTGQRSDGRFKVDILVFVGHPDDETAVTGYLARAIDHRKRLAVLYGTRGSGGGDAVGSAHAFALGREREIEVRRALTKLGVTRVWFLDGRDTEGQNGLASLAHWQHGLVLEQVVLLVRLTRPEIILTWIPSLLGDHGDHQAAGVIATEAFDMAGDPTVFPAQITTGEPLFLEGLTPWQPKKLYYFTQNQQLNLEGKSLRYFNTDISPIHHVSYKRLAMESARFHLTQDDFHRLAEALDEDAQQTNGAQNVHVDAFERDFIKEYGFDLFPDWLDVIRGKSHVSVNGDDDVFEGIDARPIGFMPPPVVRSQPPRGLSLELAGPWGFYRDFWQAHDIEQLTRIGINIDPETQLALPEIAIPVGSELYMPLRLRNGTGDKLEGVLVADLPQGWPAQSKISFAVRAHEAYEVAASVNLPDRVVDTWEAVTYHAKVRGEVIGQATLRVRLLQKALRE